MIFFIGTEIIHRETFEPLLNAFNFFYLMNQNWYIIFINFERLSKNLVKAQKVQFHAIFVHGQRFYCNELPSLRKYHIDLEYKSNMYYKLQELAKHFKDCWWQIFLKFEIVLIKQGNLVLILYITYNWRSMTFLIYEINSNSSCMLQ